MYPVELIQHHCNEGRWLAFPWSAYHLINRGSIPISARPGVQTTVPDGLNTHRSHILHGMAEVCWTARPSNASAGAGNRSFHGNLEETSPLRTSNLWWPRQPHGDIRMAQTPYTNLLQGQLGSGAFGSTSERNDLDDTTGLSARGSRGM